MVMVVSEKERSAEKEWWNKVERAIHGGWVAWRKGAVCR